MYQRLKEEQEAILRNPGNVSNEIWYRINQAVFNAIKKFEDDFKESDIERDIKNLLKMGMQLRKKGLLAE